jgi:hypothetical protein
MMKNDNLDLHEGTEAAQRFKDFTRAIMGVPKSEIDEATKKIAKDKVKVTAPLTQKRKTPHNG